MRRCLVKVLGLALASVLIAPGLWAVGCSAVPTRDPHDTQPIPDGAKFQGKCTFLGEIGCGLTSFFSGNAAYERRSACIAFIEPNGTQVEQCGSVLASTPRP